MPKLQVDVSIFSSPLDAFGNATGILELDQTPREDMPFPWPKSLTAAAPQWFTGSNATVQAIAASEEGGEPTFVLWGIVCASTAEAGRCARLLESIGLFVYEYH